jgi:hypothetical protein
VRVDDARLAVKVPLAVYVKDGVDEVESRGQT